MYEPVLCLILHGRKQVSFGEQTLSFGPGECLLVSHDLPVRSRITKAPYLALVLEVDVATIRKLYEDVEESALGGEGARAAATHRADPVLLDALCRYLALADSSTDWRRLHRLRQARKGRHLKPGDVRRWTRESFHNLGLYRLRGSVQYPEPVRC